MYQIDNQSRNPVYEQIIEQIEKYVLTGILKPEDKLLSVRAMSMELHLNPNTVQKAYTELERKGLIYTSPGKGTFISGESLDILKQDKRQKMNELVPVIRELSLAGVKKSEVIEMVEKIYEEEQK